MEIENVTEFFIDSIHSLELLSVSLWMLLKVNGSDVVGLIAT